MKERPGRSQALLMCKVVFEIRLKLRDKIIYRRKINKLRKRSKIKRVFTRNYKRPKNGKKH